MTSRVLLNKSDRDQFFKLVESYELPVTVTIAKGKNRSIEQNRLQRLWLNEAAEQLDNNQTAEELRGYCKLHFGVPILRESNEDFRAAYDRVIKPLAYELKLLAMMEPLDFPVTRLMTTKQSTEYLDAIHKHFSELGCRLTDPEGAIAA